MTSTPPMKVRGIDLLPCPFCGTPDPRFQLQAGGYSIDCLTCGVMVRQTTQFIEQIVTQWNNRPASTIETQLLAHVRKFIADQEISCAESVCQNDRVILNAYAFIEGCCEIAGYHVDPEDA